ncbi:THAP domain-containing protein 2-like [Rhipicephalus microplus]|uniref:THAP domain-containing protein 2-like n=1 Tax=Rhipicephalus microplus TaxID=6941 RepID=UPI003F6C120D
MVQSCVAYGCTNRAIPASKITFHRFPKDAETRNLWERAVRREHWKPTDKDRLCSAHFDPACFDRTGQTTRLKAGSVPTSFAAFPAHLQAPVKRKRPAPKPRGCSPAQQQEASNTEDHVTVSPSKQWLCRSQNRYYKHL